MKGIVNVTKRAHGVGCDEGEIFLRYGRRKGDLLALNWYRKKRSLRFKIASEHGLIRGG